MKEQELEYTRDQKAHDRTRVKTTRDRNTHDIADYALKHTMHKKQEDICMIQQNTKTHGITTQKSTNSRTNGSN